jgi:LacI family transcriptional regulator
MTKQITYTMRDVARLAGVSVSTVSAVVNKKGIVSPELTEKVQRAIEAMGFRPHAGARGLRLGRTHIIGMVLQDITNPFFVEVMRGVEEEAIKNGYEIIVCNSNGRSELEQKHLNALYTQRVDAILLAPCDSYAAREVLVGHHSPMVFMDCVPMRAEVLSVVTDNFAASFEATRYLLGLGHRRVAIISGRGVHSTIVDRVEGFRRAMEEAHIPILGDQLRYGGSNIESGYDLGLALLKSPEPPTAIFALNNRMTLGILQALRELKIPCPEQVSVLGFDDFDWAAVSDPPLSAIAQPTDEIGKRAVELALGSIRAEEEGTTVEKQQIVLKCSLRVRKSTGPPPKAAHSQPRREKTEAVPSPTA